MELFRRELLIDVASLAYLLSCPKDMRREFYDMSINEDINEKVFTKQCTIGVHLAI